MKISLIVLISLATAGFVWLMLICIHQIEFSKGTYSLIFPPFIDNTPKIFLFNFSTSLRFCDIICQYLILMLPNFLWNDRWSYVPCSWKYRWRLPHCILQPCWHYVLVDIFHSKHWFWVDQLRFGCINSCCFTSNNIDAWIL